MKTLLISLLSLFLVIHLQAQSPLTRNLASKVILDSSYRSIRGLVQRDIKYLDQSAKLISVHIVMAKLKKRRLVMEAATPFNRDSFARQTVTEEMKWATASGHTTVAGINADFFNMKNGEPLGIVIKDGQILKGHFNHTNCFVGVLKNGRVFIGDSLDFKKLQPKLVQALGARPRLIKDGKILVQDTSSLSRVHHPRSALGVRGKRTVFFVTVDGRSPLISNGISLTDLATLMQLLGAENAVNLDGGGSTTLVIRPAGSDTLKVKNHPSDKVPRKVANAWVLIRKQ